MVIPGLPDFSLPYQIKPLLFYENDFKVVTNSQIYFIFAYSLPLLALYMMMFFAMLGGDPVPGSRSSFYPFLAFISLMDICHWFLTVIVYRLTIFFPLNEFYNSWDGGRDTSFIYGGMFFFIAAREGGLVAMALNRLTSVLYNGKTWAFRSIFLSLLLSLIFGYCCTYFCYDTLVQFMKISMGNDTAIFALALDDTEREWLHETWWTIGWAGAALGAMTVCYIIIAFQLLCGGAHPEAEQREKRLAMTGFLCTLPSLLFLGLQFGALLVDRDDPLTALRVFREAGPIVPMVMDFRIFFIPICIMIRDCDARRATLRVLGMRGAKVRRMSASQLYETH